MRLFISLPAYLVSFGDGENLFFGPNEALHNRGVDGEKIGHTE